jgi:hypothetical protein
MSDAILWLICAKESQSVCPFKVREIQLSFVRQSFWVQGHFEASRKVDSRKEFDSEMRQMSKGIWRDEKPEDTHEASPLSHHICHKYYGQEINVHIRGVHGEKA